MRILIADDSKDIALRLQRLLLDLPFVTSAVVKHTTDAVVAELHSNPPDLLILDHHFPEGKGLDVLRKMAGFANGYRVVVFSAYADSLETELYRGFHIDALLDKSRDLDNLLDMVGKMHAATMQESGTDRQQN
jgi:CheY-like chemotaxis protein